MLIRVAPSQSLSEVGIDVHDWPFLAVGDGVTDDTSVVFILFSIVVFLFIFTSSSLVVLCTQTTCSDAIRAALAACDEVCALFTVQKTLPRM